METGGSNIQFAVDPKTGRMVVIEMNPRVSRSSALASKATGFPIAKFAAKLAVGYTLDEISNDITKTTPASFEPSIDYCVVKIPRFAFEKFPKADATLTIQMKSVGETMAIGRTFKEALQKGVRSLEIGRFGLCGDGKEVVEKDLEKIKSKLTVPNAERLFYIVAAFKAGMTKEEIFQLTQIDIWFLDNIEQILEMESKLKELFEGKKPSEKDLLSLDDEIWWEAKQFGFSDPQLANLWQSDPATIRKIRKEKGVLPVYKLVDTCAGEFEAYTPYYYSTYEKPFLLPNGEKQAQDEARASDKKKIMILGGGPNRIGQGIEFDYCCVHASFALREDGIETIMVNSNPETVSTDYDTSDKLYFEPLTLEDVLNIYENEQADGAIVQFGGQTPLNLSKSLEANGVTIIGTSPKSIEMAEDRELFQKMLHKLDIVQPKNGIATSAEQAIAIAQKVSYPVVVRPSFVLGGRAMEIVYDDEMIQHYMEHAVKASPEHPILIDKFLEDAIEVDVDAICDGERVVIGAIMEHIEEAGIHSGDSACVTPPHTLSDNLIRNIREYTHAMALELKVRGLMNVQYAIKNDVVYVFEVNPRASRTVPFVSKSIGQPLAKIAARVMSGKSLQELGFTSEVKVEHFSVKEAVLPFVRFPGVDTLLGPEMKSTGEVMGIDSNFGVAFANHGAFTPTT